ncbi:hypothetical protein CBR_g51402 [Chara braunii]|uniref:Reverse transcriptase n=1 Tax=Chara braunii TaxID=69332 RepID=A0A388M8I3_CHABU|nr:hypothetical protein CBR_g51402 [Chara braunii]|eukprot:GBG90894.1 hypothetical protein CBR_g51402 [Chara braunii]
MLLRSQTAVMDQRAGETDEAYQARMLAWSTETKKRADDAAAAAKKKAEDTEQARLLAVEQQRQHAEAAARAADEERAQRREMIFTGERALLTMAAEWRTEAENSQLEDSVNKIALLLSHLTDLLATCITQQAEILGLDNSVAHLQDRLQRLDQRPVAAADASSSNTADRLNALELDVGSLKDGAQVQQTATQQLQQRLGTTATTSSPEPHESAPKFDGQEIFCDSIKTDPIPWFRKFELTLQLQNVKEHKHHAYLYSRPWTPYGISNTVDRIQGAREIPLLPLVQQRSSSDAGLPIERQGETGKLSTAESDATTLSTPSELVSSRVTSLHSEAHAEVDSPPLLLSFEDYAARLVPTVGTQAQGQGVCAVSSPSGNSDISSSSGSSRDSVREFNIQALDLLTSEDFAWLPLPTTDCLPGPQCAALSAHLHTNLSFYAPPTSPTDDEVAVGDILAYTTKVAREFCTQWYDNNNAPLMYVRIQVGQASCSALLDSGATRNFMSQSFMQRAGLGAQVRRKANPTAIKLADGKTQQLLDRYIEAVPFYFAPHACEPVTFDILDMDFDIILGMPLLASADHTVNWHRRTLSVRDAFGAEVALWCQNRPISHEIILEAGAVPPKGCIYRMSEKEFEVLRAQLDDLLAKGWIRPSSSLYGAPVLFVRKKNKDLRLCIDYRKLNAQTVKNAGPLPRIDDLLERLGGAKYFSKLDLKSGYHQISIRPNDRYKTAFKTWYGHLEWVVMPFGLTNAPTTSQAAMTNEFRAMLDRFVLVYLDDILVYSRSLEDHLRHLRRVLETLRRAKYKANRDKCEFVRQELEYLGHFVTPEGISPLSDKIQVVSEWPEPRNVTDVRSFLGLTGYYQHFIKGYSKIAAHLNKLQCEDRPFDFGEEARGSFLALKAALLSTEVLRIYDPLAPTHVTTDASGYGIGVTINSTIARWMAFIDQFDFFPDHIPGKSNRFADALSRRPDHCTAVYSTFKIDDDLQNSFIRGYQADPDFRDKYANCSSPNPAPSHYRIQEGYLLVHTRGKDLLCVPSDPHLRTRLLGEFQDAPATGHFGVDHTIGRLRQRFWWPGLLGDVRRYCESCEVCRRCKSRNHRPYGELQPLPVSLRRREAIAMDITGPFPKHKTGVDGILTVVDRLTKFAMFLPCRYHAKAPELAEVLYPGWIRTKGYPKEIVCDRDTRFMSDFWLALIKRWGSSLKPSSACHPQTDGQTERAHQTAQVLLRTLIRPDQKDWVERLPEVELAYNSSIHPAIGISSFEFEHSSPVTSPLDTITPRTAESDDHLLFLRRMQELLVEARDQMAKTQQRMSQQANRQRLPCPFCAGDLV